MTEDKKIEKLNFRETCLDNEYYKCTFESCDFSEMEIDNTVFEDCTFKLCNFSLAKLFGIFRDVKFTECKMLGADFTKIGKFATSFTFEKSRLDYVSFAGLKMRKTVFRDCNLSNAYFDEADISSSLFQNCDLSYTSFDNTNLEKVDFSTSYNFSINPVANRLKGAIFPENGLRGLVSHLNIKIV